jgi:YVTN family beta-propeller protein
LVLVATFVLAHAQKQAGPSLLVLNKSEATMSIVDPATLQVLARVPTGEAPHEATTSSDGKLAFIANYGTGPKPGNTISIVDIAARKEVKRVDLGPLLRPHGITESGGKVYFTVEGSRAVARLDAATLQLDWVVGTGQTGSHMVVVTPDSKKVFTANIGSDTVTAIEPGATPGTSKITQIAVGKGPEGIDLSPDGSELWVAHRGDGELSIIDPSSYAVKETLKVGRMPIRVKFTPDGQRVLVSDAQTGEVVVFDRTSRKELKRIAVGAAPVGILITPDGARAFVASTQANKVSVIDLQSLAIKGVLEPGREPDGMAWAR